MDIVKYYYHSLLTVSLTCSHRLWLKRYVTIYFNPKIVITKHIFLLSVEKFTVFTSVVAWWDCCDLFVSLFWVKWFSDYNHHINGTISGCYNYPWSNLCRCDKYSHNIVQHNVHKMLSEVKTFGYTMDLVKALASIYISLPVFTYGTSI